MSVLMINFPVNLSPLMRSLLQIIWWKLRKINFLNKQFLAPNFAMLDGNSKQISSTQVFCRCFGSKFWVSQSLFISNNNKFGFLLLDIYILLDVFVCSIG